MLNHMNAIQFDFEQTIRKMTVRSLALQPNPTSPLANLVGNSMDLTSTKDNWIYSAMFANAVRSVSGGLVPISYSGADAIDQNSPEDMGQYRHYRSSHSQGHLQMVEAIATVIAKNMVVIKDASEMIKNCFDLASKELIAVEGTPPLNIVPLFGGGIISPQSQLQDMLGYKGDLSKATMLKFSPLGSFASVADINAFPFEKIAVTGNVAIDKELKEWLLSGGMSVMFSTYGAVFSIDAGENHPDYDIGYFNKLAVASSKGASVNGFQRDIMSLDALLSMWLICRNIEQCADLPITGNTSLGTIRSKLHSMQLFCAANLSRILSSIRAQKESKKVIHVFPTSFNESSSWTENHAILVDAEVYDEFIKSGGSPEVILGAYLTDSQPRYLGELLENAGRLTDVYHERIATLKLKRENIQINKALEVVRDQLTLDVNSDNSPLKASGERILIQKAFTEFSRQLNRDTVKSLYSYIRDLYCNTIYCGCDVGEIMRSIDNLPAGKSRDSLIRAGLMQYATKFLLSQCSFDRLKDA